MKSESKTIKLFFSGKLLKDLTKIWKDSEEPNDFNYWLRSFIKEKLYGKK